ncbi:hypothetical protein ACS0TY_035218 [Phlomoides rotata]
MTGDPYYAVKLGRKDSFTSIASSVEGNLPRPTMPMNQIIRDTVLEFFVAFGRNWK